MRGMAVDVLTAGTVWAEALPAGRSLFARTWTSDVTAVTLTFVVTAGQATLFLSDATPQPTRSNYQVLITASEGARGVQISQING
jgi:hypothetical protein